MAAKDRLNQLLDPGNTTLNGIDYVEVAGADQTILRVHFLNANAVATSLTGELITVAIMGGAKITNVEVLPIQDPADWSGDASGRPILTVRVAAPGDFSIYTLNATSGRVDRFFNAVPFSFKVLCPSDLDCAQPAELCPPDATPAPPIDYLAKDFLSFRQALLDFSAQRYPRWQERSEADFSVMFMEALAALADYLSYQQDRLSWEAALETATQRLSLMRHARLVDYEPRPATAAQVLLQVDVTAGPLPGGLPIGAQGPDGQTIGFETGEGLIDPRTGLPNAATYVINPAWNRGALIPYIWDDSQLCLRRGATEMWIEGNHPELEGVQLLIDTAPLTPGDPPVREVVTIPTGGVKLEQDLLFAVSVTHLTWGSDQALAHDHDLSPDAKGSPRTTLAGNLVPATQGRTVSETFAIDVPPASAPRMPLALVRTGANGAPLYLYPLRGAPLAWLAEDDADAVPQPEVVLEQISPGPHSGPWIWHKRLLAAPRFTPAYTVEPTRYAPIAQNSDRSWSYEYDGDEGASLRFGDGDFGEIPEKGAVFRVRYRVGGGVAGNVAADAVSKVEPAGAAWINSVTNPFVAAGGSDEESDEQVRRRAPHAFRARQYRAVRPSDYNEAAETLSSVQQAGTVFRWTGSWLTVFTTADPVGRGSLSADQHLELANLLNRYRLAGYEAYAPTPRYAALDLIVSVCARTDAFRGDVEAGVLAQLGAGILPGSARAFFHVDNFTFGTPLERSMLAAAIQGVPGVAGVLSLQVRRRGVTPGYVEMLETLVVGRDEIIRVDNDPSRPEFGSLKVIVEGGK